MAKFSSTVGFQLLKKFCFIIFKVTKITIFRFFKLLKKLFSLPPLVEVSHF